MPAPSPRRPPILAPPIPASAPQSTAPPRSPRWASRRSLPGPGAPAPGAARPRSARSARLTVCRYRHRTARETDDRPFRRRSRAHTRRRIVSCPDPLPLDRSLWASRCRSCSTRDSRSSPNCRRGCDRRFPSFPSRSSTHRAERSGAARPGSPAPAPWPGRASAGSAASSRPGPAAGRPRPGRSTCPPLPPSLESLRLRRFRRSRGLRSYRRGECRTRHLARARSRAAAAVLAAADRQPPAAEARGDGMRTAVIAGTPEPGSGQCHGVEDGSSHVGSSRLDGRARGRLLRVDRARAPAQPEALTRWARPRGGYQVRPGYPASARRAGAAGTPCCASVSSPMAGSGRWRSRPRRAMSTSTGRRSRPCGNGDSNRAGGATNPPPCGYCSRRVPLAMSAPMRPP